VNKAFFGDGKSRSSGDFIDLRNKRWRNERALLKGGYIRYATAEEVQGFSPPRNLSSSVVPENVLEDREYLERRYAETSGLAIAKEIGCHPAKVYKALRKFSIETRPGGFQKNKMNYEKWDLANAVGPLEQNVKAGVMRMCSTLLFLEE